MKDETTTPHEEPRFGACAAPFDTCTVSLALYGTSLDPSLISNRLGCQPTSAHKKDARRTPRSAPAPCGVWRLDEEETLPTHLGEVVGRLLDRLPSDPEIWAQLVRDYQVQIRFAFQASTWSGCFEIDAKTAGRLAATGATLAFHLYSA